MAETEAKPKATKKLRALQRLENVAMDGAGNVKEVGSWVVEAGDLVASDHPAVALHPAMFADPAAEAQ